jgi:cysteinyl-tRNA synthetase
MARAVLGDEIDVHSGGEDNIFPHHECEIAQSRGTTGCDAFAKYWFHTRHLMVNGAKMSKSSGTFFTIRDLLDKGASPAAIRLELTRTHYRINANFTMQGLRDAQRQIDRWVRVARWLETHAETQRTTDDPGPMQRALVRFTAAMSDDLNVAGAIGALNIGIGEMSIDDAPPAGTASSTWQDELAAFRAMDSVLGVLELETSGDDTEDTSEIDAIIQARREARENRDWGRADELRDELLAMGIAIKDGGGETSWERIVQ